MSKTKEQKDSTETSEKSEKIVICDDNNSSLSPRYQTAAVSNNFNHENNQPICQEKNNKVSKWTGVLPGFATFITFSTLIDSKGAFGLVMVGIVLGIINAFALYKSEKKPLWWARFTLILLECAGILCMSYDAIHAFHWKVKSSLTPPFNGMNDTVKSSFGILLAVLALIFIGVSLRFDHKEQVLKQQENIKGVSRIHSKQKKLIIVMVLIGTYPLMVAFLSDLNHGKSTLWLCAVALVIAFGSAIFQSFLIGHYEHDHTIGADVSSHNAVLNKRHYRMLWYKYLGKLFMASEIILSLANTAFSSNQSSVDDLIDMFNSESLSNHAKHIGLGLFIVSLLIFLYVTQKHFDIFLKSDQPYNGIHKQTAQEDSHCQSQHTTSGCSNVAFECT